jgi:preprotein translocase subunit SecF
MLAMLFQVLYIRLRFADYKHGFAAVCALIHDTVIALGCVAVFDASGLIHAKINLVLIAAFLTLIGYSMNDTIVVFDRIRENLGKGRLVLTGVVNDSINQTLTRSIRTSLTTWVVVLIMFAVNWHSGSVLEGFAFVMLIGVVTGTYSSIFIAAPLLLFLPVFGKKFAANQTVAWVRVVASLVGAIVALQSVGHHASMWIGVVLAVNVPLQFFYELARWLPLADPDALLQSEIEHEEDLRPLTKPGI